MPRRCSVCDHPDRREIDHALVTRSASYRAIARHYSVSKDAVSRHTKEHLPVLLAKGHEAELMSEADALLMDIKKLQDRTLLMLQKAEKADDLRTALVAVSQARQNLALLVELRGALDRRPQMNVLISSPEWQELKALLLGVLDAHPLAKADVVQAIETTKEGNGQRQLP